ncbi:uncharacterized protein [Triticum aestivum]|uniref:uncharacterized protein n=1 Tax=Triticum aestivum TaxID=4565 RepID=UPI001D003C29|nr:uncharacterized protein LOC123179106 [Triticum aestivum]
MGRGGICPIHPVSATATHSKSLGIHPQFLCPINPSSRSTPLIPLIPPSCCQRPCLVRPRKETSPLLQLELLRPCLCRLRPPRDPAAPANLAAGNHHQQISPAPPFPFLLLSSPSHFSRWFSFYVREPSTEAVPVARAPPCTARARATPSLATRLQPPWSHSAPAPHHLAAARTIGGPSDPRPGHCRASSQPRTKSHDRPRHLSFFSGSCAGERPTEPALFLVSSLPNRRQQQLPWLCSSPPASTS